MSFADSESPVSTGEIFAPVFAGFWVRFVAHLIDSTLLTVIAWVLEWGLLWVFYGLQLLFVSGSGSGLAVPSFEDAFGSLFLQVFNVGLYFCFAFPYYVWGHYRWGTTLGKKVFGVTVVQADNGEKITLKQSIWRFFLYGLSYLPMGIGFLMVAFQPRKQGLHDVLAGTVSVRR